MKNSREFIAIPFIRSYIFFLDFLSPVFLKFNLNWLNWRINPILGCKLQLVTFQNNCVMKINNRHNNLIRRISISIWISIWYSMQHGRFEHTGDSLIQRLKTPMKCLLLFRIFMSWRNQAQRIMASSLVRLNSYPINVPTITNVTVTLLQGVTH